MVGNEIVAAFGAENAVTVVSPGDRNAAGSAPFVMDGSIGRLGPAVRFTMNLKSRRSGVVLWSGGYEHEAADAVAARQAAGGRKPGRALRPVGCVLLQEAHVRIRRCRCTSNGATSIGAGRPVKRPSLTPRGV